MYRRPRFTTSNLLFERCEQRLYLSGIGLTAHDIDEVSRAALFVVAADVNGDNNLDVVARGSRNITWYENEGDGNFGSERPITNNAAEAMAVGDIDNDGDLDVVYSTGGEFDGVLTWTENVDGLGTFGESHPISSGGRRVPLLQLGDLDGDSDLDVIAMDFDEFRWYENTGEGSFIDPKPIPRTSNEFIAIALELADMDGDNDVDIVSSRFASVFGENEGEIVWNENTDGKGSFGEPRPIGDTSAGSLTLEDLDDDGDIDVLAAMFSRHCTLSCVSVGDVRWHRNSDGQGDFEIGQVISTDADAFNATAGDVDGDGDLDVLAASTEKSELVMFPNSGSAVFEESTVISPEAIPVSSVALHDLDTDGDLDMLLTTSDFDVNSRIVWYESDVAGDEELRPGDLNADGKVDFADFLLLSANFGRLDATWSDGDFTGDSQVTFDDFLVLSANFDHTA